jgi:hypothetical protein
MNSFITIAISLVLAAGSILPAQAGIRRADVASENLKRAEQLADRFVERFKETLDFEVVYREFFITDSEKRLLNPTSIILDSEQHGEIKKEISPTEIEQAYKGFMNLYYLMSLYLSNVLTEEEESESEIKSEELFPPELLKAMKEPASCFFFTDYVKDASCKETPEPYKTAEDVRRFVREASHVAMLLRKYMPPEPFSSPKYKAHLAQMEWDGRTTDINQGDEHFGIGEETTVYQIYRGLFVLNIVEENSEMKVAGIPIGN